MKPEDRLRDAMRARAETIEPATDAWVRIRERIDRPTARSRRARGWQLSLAGFAAAGLVVALVAGLLVLRDDDDGGKRVATPSTDSIGGDEREPLPNFVAVKQDGSVVVITSADGRERKIADGADADTTLAVTPDGKRVYFDRPGSASSECGPNREIVRVPTKGGDARVVAKNAGDPAVSPNGKQLAYVKYPGSSGCLNPDALVVQRVKGSSGRSWTVEADEVVAAPSWAPDSRHLAVVVGVVFGPRGGQFSYRTVDTEARAPLSDAPLLELGPDFYPHGYFGQSDRLLASEVTPAGGRLLVLQPSTGAVEQVILSFDADHAPLRATASPLGKNVLYVAPGTGAAFGLYVWQEVAPTPVAFTEGILAAAFIPAAAER